MAISHKDLQELVTHSVITPDNARAIQQYYAAKKNPEGNTLLTIFGILGGILTGLGIILIFAHNWDNFSRITKTTLAFLPLILFQAFAAWTILKDRSAVWKEAAATLLFFAVGSSISLVAQIYNISGDLGQFLLTWTVLCLPLMYLLRSNAVTVLCLGFATWYAAEVSYLSYPGVTPWLYLLVIVAFVPLYHRHLKDHAESHTTIALNWLLPLSFIISFGGFLHGADEFTFFLYMAFFGLLYTVGAYAPALKGKVNGYVAFGRLGMIVMLFFGSFRFTWHSVIKDFVPVPFIVFGLVLVALSSVIIFAAKALKNADHFKYIVFIFPLIYILAMGNDAAATVVTNLLLLAVGLFYVRRGIRALNFRIVNFGLIIITILTICRFFDTDLTFVLRGLMFVGVGLGFFAANYAVVKRKKLTANTTTYEN